MNIRKGLVASAATLAVCWSSVAVAQHETTGWEWTRASSPNGVYSVDLPCNSDEIITDIPAMPNRAVYDAGSAIACIKDGWFMTAGVVTAPRGSLEASGIPNLFDNIVERFGRLATSQPSQFSDSYWTSVSGRRAFVTWGSNDAVRTQNGIVELGASAYVHYNIFALTSSGADFDAVPNAIERFSNTFRVAEDALAEGA